MKTKVCLSCKQRRKIDDFYSNRRSYGGVVRRPECKQCTMKRRKDKVIRDIMGKRKKHLGKRCGEKK